MPTKITTYQVTQDGLRTLGRGTLLGAGGEEPGGGGGEEPPPQTGPLARTPPGYPNYDGYLEVEVNGSTTVNNFSLRNDRDYIIRCTDTTRHLQIAGGRNIVMIGGHTEITDQGAFTSGMSPSAGDRRYLRRGIDFQDAGGVQGSGNPVDGRIIHLEGWKIDGIDLGDGVNFECPTAVFQWQNCYVGLGKVRSEDDRNGTGVYGPARSGYWMHPDIFQPHHGLKEAWFDTITGIDGYQGFFLKCDNYGNNPNPDYHFRRINIRCVTWTKRGDDPDNPGSTGGGGTRTGSFALWLPHPADRPLQAPGKLYIESSRNDGFYVERGNDNPPALVAGPRGEDPDPNGDGSWSWPTSFTHPVDGGEWVRNWGDTGSGKIWKGLPPGGDFCPPTVPGLNYQSPGYE